MSDKAMQGKIRLFRAVNSPLGHWWYQRLTAAALVPSSVWLIVLTHKALSAPYADTFAWLSSPLNAAAIGLWIMLANYHAALGLRVVIEDYVSTVSLRNQAIRLCNLIFGALGLAGLAAIIFIFLTR